MTETAKHPEKTVTFPTVLWLLLIIVVLLIASGLRLHNLGAQSLWNDEGTSVAMTDRNPAAIIANTAADIHPPGYYLLLAGWVQATGKSEFALRAPSTLASILTAASLYALGRRLYGRGAGLVVLFFFTLNTFAIYYAQETRMYAQLGLFATASMTALAFWLTDRSGRSPYRYIIALGLLNAAGLYTHYAFPITMVAQGIVFIAVWGMPVLETRKSDWPVLGWYVLANGTALILFAPWVGEAIRQITTWPSSGGPASAQTILSTVTFGVTLAGGVGWLALFAALILAASLWMQRDRMIWFLPVIWAAATVGTFLVLGLQADDIKQLLPATSAIALWMGAGLSALWRDDCITPRTLAVASTAILAITFATAIPSLYSDASYQRNDYRSIAQTVAQHTRPGDAVILNGPGQGEVWSYYTAGQDSPVFPLPRNLGGDDEATLVEMDSILQDYRRIYALFWGEDERDPNHIVETMLDTNAFEVSAAWVGDIRFVTYAIPGESSDTPTQQFDLAFATQEASTPSIILEGIAFDRAQYLPGEVMTLTLFWQALQPMDTRYKVFVHIYADENAPPIAQHDAEPAGGDAPTSGWRVGETIIDRHGVLLPPDLPRGTYTVAVGLYDAADPQARLTSSAGDRVDLTSITIE